MPQRHGSIPLPCSETYCHYPPCVAFSGDNFCTQSLSVDDMHGACDDTQSRNIHSLENEHTAVSTSATSPTVGRTDAATDPGACRHAPYFDDTSAHWTADRISLECWTRQPPSAEMGDIPDGSDQEGNTACQEDSAMSAPEPSLCGCNHPMSLRLWLPNNNNNNLNNLAAFSTSTSPASFHAWIARTSTTTDEPPVVLVGPVCTGSTMPAAAAVDAAAASRAPAATWQVAGGQSPFANASQTSFHGRPSRHVPPFDADDMRSDWSPKIAIEPSVFPASRVSSLSHQLLPDPTEWL